MTIKHPKIPSETELEIAVEYAEFLASLDEKTLDLVLNEPKEKEMGEE